MIIGPSIISKVPSSISISTISTSHSSTISTSYSSTISTSYSLTISTSYSLTISTSYSLTASFITITISLSRYSSLEYCFRNSISSTRKSGTNWMAILAIIAVLAITAKVYIRSPTLILQGTDRVVGTPFLAI